MDAPEPSPPPRPWSVALIEDDVEFRTRLERAFGATPDWHCVGGRNDLNDILPWLAETRPHLLLLDIQFRTGKNGDTVIGDLLRHQPDLRIVMLTVSARPETISSCLCQGAVGYLVKGAPWSEILQFAESAMLGGPALTPSIARWVIREFARLSSITASGPNPTSDSPLSPAETTVLDRCARGETEAEIAASLGKSKYTVRAQFRSILNKLNANNRTQAVAKALRNGWISRP